jgi:TrAA12-like
MTYAAITYGLGDGEISGDGLGDDSGDGDGDAPGDREGDNSGDGDGDTPGDGEGDDSGDGETVGRATGCLHPSLHIFIAALHVAALAPAAFLHI